MLTQMTPFLCLTMGSQEQLKAMQNSSLTRLPLSFPGATFNIMTLYIRAVNKDPTPHVPIIWEQWGPSHVAAHDHLCCCQIMPAQLDRQICWQV